MRLSYAARLWHKRSVMTFPDARPAAPAHEAGAPLASSVAGCMAHATSARTAARVPFRRVVARAPSPVGTSEAKRSGATSAPHRHSAVRNGMIA
ncbi:hypothetical protein ASE95_00765 [Sphingomonas sp. Leaf231]|nr:hypothetical protein ASE95_00765 [Sphingomonas sp. Leaf231]